MIFHGTEVRQHALTLLRNGAKNADVARKFGVPRGTIAYWKHLDRAKRGECPGRHDPRCPRCDGRDLDPASYSYLLGLYLGDGHISHYSAHRVPNLMITCAESWPGLMDHCEQAMRRVFPDNAVCRVRKTGCRNVKVYSKHLHCLFPQHGPGKKHQRLIALEPWQREIVDTHPWEFIRGLIHSDRLPHHQLDHPPRRWRAQALRVPAVLLLQQVGRHPEALHRHPQQGRRRVDDPRSRQRSFQHLHRPQSSVALMDIHVGLKH